MGGNAYTQVNISSGYGFAVGDMGVSRVVYNGSTEYVYYNGVLKTNSGWGSAAYDNLPIMLFALGFDQSGGVYEGGGLVKGAMYYAKVFNADGELIRSFVPVRRNSDNKCGMYDTVSGTFFGSATSTAFTCP